MKTTVISVLGTQKDAHGGTSPARWNTWRPTIGLVQQEALRIDELHLIFNAEFKPLAEQVGADIATVSPETKVVFDIVELKDPWDFEEVYEKFYDYARKPCFHEEGTDYYIHITTGSHVEQICLFLLAESHHLMAKLVQLAHVIGVCRESSTAADAAKRLFAVSRLAKKTANDSDRLSKYLVKFGLRFRDLAKTWSGAN